MQLRKGLYEGRCDAHAIECQERIVITLGVKGWHFGAPLAEVGEGHKERLALAPH